MAIGDYYKFSVELQFSGQTYVNVFHYRQEFNPGGGAPNNAQGLIYQWSQGISGGLSVMNRYNLCIPSVVTLYKIKAFCITNVADTYESIFNTPGNRGSTDICPPQCAAVITWRTPSVGRRFRGRSFIGPVREVDQTAGLLDTGTFIPALAAFAAAQLAMFGPTTTHYRHVVYSRILDTGIGITSSTVRTAMKTQRRRARLGT